MALVALFSAFDATFRDYSARFGALTEAEFARLNDRMDTLRLLSRVVLFGGFFPLDAATAILGFREWRRVGGATPLVVAILAALLGVSAALLTALAAAMPSGRMIG